MFNLDWKCLLCIWEVNIILNILPYYGLYSLNIKSSYVHSFALQLSRITKKWMLVKQSLRLLPEPLFWWQICSSGQTSCKRLTSIGDESRGRRYNSFSYVLDCELQSLLLWNLNCPIWNRSSKFHFLLYLYKFVSEYFDLW